MKQLQLKRAEDSSLLLHTMDGEEIDGVYSVMLEQQSSGCMTATVKFYVCENGLPLNVTDSERT